MHMTVVHCRVQQVGSDCLQVAADLYLRAGGNELLNYLKVQEAGCLAELTACARDDTYEAVNAFIHRLLGTGVWLCLCWLCTHCHVLDLHVASVLVSFRRTPRACPWTVDRPWRGLRLC